MNAPDSCRWAWWLWLLPVLQACAHAQPPALAPAPCGPGAAPQEIVWEQDCNGCRQGLRLRFGADGQALLTRTGKARLRTADEAQPVALPPAAFAQLASELAAAGLFTLGPGYEEPGLADGRWTLWRAQCGSHSHEVFRREAAGPPALDVLDTIVTRWQQRLWPSR
jgi:hypothetical protein